MLPQNTNRIPASFVYDGDGKQIKATVNGITAVYVGNHYEVKNNIVTKYYFAGATRLAVRTDGTLRFLLGDHLGSSSVTTNASGAKTASALYKAFGETRFTSGTLSTDYKFTGQREESALGGIYFFQARWFDPTLGRFMSPDTIVPTSTQGTQAWDRYAFVNNNPVRYTDPTGHMGCDPEAREEGNCEEDKATSTSQQGGGEDLLCTDTTDPCVGAEYTHEEVFDLTTQMTKDANQEFEDALKTAQTGVVIGAIAALVGAVALAPAVASVAIVLAGVAIAGIVVGASLTAFGLVQGYDASTKSNTASLISSAAGDSDSVHIAASLSNKTPTIRVMGSGGYNSFSAGNSGFLLTVNSIMSNP